jgi:hypothetical protein
MANNIAITMTTQKIRRIEGCEVKYRCSMKVVDSWHKHEREFTYLKKSALGSG